MSQLNLWIVILVGMLAATMIFYTTNSLIDALYLNAITMVASSPVQATAALQSTRNWWDNWPTIFVLVCVAIIIISTLRREGQSQEVNPYAY